MPTKVLDAPALYDDFYLNLIDWSASNLLAVGLSNSVYLWNAGNSKVVRLVELSSNDLVTSCSSSPSSNVLGVGTHLGEVQLWDCIRHKKISTSKGHAARVGAIAWNSNNVFASGSRDKNILIRDIRVKDDFVNKMVGHKQ
jgi:cell division cycle 20-like protein 1 (cofactor of APC complex)